MSTDDRRHIYTLYVNTVPLADLNSLSSICKGFYTKTTCDILSKECSHICSFINGKSKPCNQTPEAMLLLKPEKTNRG